MNANVIRINLIEIKLFFKFKRECNSDHFEPYHTAQDQMFVQCECVDPDQINRDQSDPD